MHQYERNGVVVDQCSECKGIFLDRGELEKLVTAESAWYGAAAAPAAVRGDRRDEGHYRPRYDSHHDDDDDDHRRGSYSKKQRRRSFLEDLFD